MPISAILDVCGRNYPPDRLTLKLIDSLRPPSFEQAKDGIELAMMYLRFAKMKITYKLMQLKVDKAVFFESLAVGNSIPLGVFVSRIGSQHSVFFS